MGTGNVETLYSLLNKQNYMLYRPLSNVAYITSKYKFCVYTGDLHGFEKYSYVFTWTAK
jgi:hypothetical protein